MLNFEVNVTGAGGLVNVVTKIIEKALDEHGYTTRQVNDHPDTSWLKPIHDRIGEGSKVTITTKHVPWGG